MSFFAVRPVSRLRGELRLSGDKSIAHRALILSAISKGTIRIKNFPANDDCLTTIEAFRKLGIKIISRPVNKKLKTHSRAITVYGKGLLGLRKPKSPIFLSESGTTLRLLLGVLAGQKFKTKLTAAKSLSRRPMLRVTAPLRMMGACITASRKAVVRRSSFVVRQEEYAPIIIRGGNLHPITYKMKIASAQVKSALLLAGLYADGKTTIIEPLPTRDHTERMLKLFKAGIKVSKNNIVIKGKGNLVAPKEIYIPADISSAAFFIVLAVITPDSKLIIRNAGLNPARTGALRVLRRMGANIKCTSAPVHQCTSEPMGDIIVKSSSLKGMTVKKEEVPSLIDELPILMVAAAFAEGRSVFEGIGELRVKETDRIKSMLYNLKKMGAEITVLGGRSSERVVIKGTGGLKGSNSLKSFGDHRTAMSVIVAALNAKGKSSIDDVSCIDKSFPGFITLLKALKD